MAATQMYTAIVLSIAFTAAVTAPSTGMRDVCQWETFEAKCQDDEVVLIKEARYGRMKVGRCQPRNYFVGCSADVTAMMHARCSGRKHCSVPVPDPVMFAATPCPKDLVTYLEADYECVKIAKSNSGNCDDQILTKSRGYITKLPTKMDHQSRACPHHILAQPGQTVNVYLYDFYSETATHNKLKPKCLPYGTVSEPDTNAPTHICGGAFRTNQLIHSSNTNIVDISLTVGSSHSHHYLLHYEVIGCPTLRAPTNSWMKITGNSAVITCNSTNIAVSLVCAGNKWVGDLQNCTQFMGHPFADSIRGNAFTDIFANTGMLVIICVGLALGVLFGMGLLAFSLNYIKDHHAKNPQVIGITPTPLLEKSTDFIYEPTNEKPPMPADQYQPVYVPISLDARGQYAPVHPVYETPLPQAFSDLNTSQAPMGIYTPLDTRIPITQNTYGPLYANQQMAGGNFGHHLHDLAALSHTLGREKIISIEDADFS